MKVFNLTDVSTRQLRHQGLANCPIKVDGVIIQPGTHGEVRDTSATRKYLQQNFVNRDAVAMDKVPKGYTGTAADKVTPPPKPRAPAPDVTDPPADSEPPPPPGITDTHPEIPPPPDTQPASGSEEEEEVKPKRKKRGSKRSS